MSLPSAGNGKNKDRMYDAAADDLDGFEEDLGFDAGYDDETVYAEEQGEYAEEQGEYAEEQADAGADEYADEAAEEEYAAPAQQLATGSIAELTQMSADTNMLLANLVTLMSGRKLNAHAATVHAGSLDQRVTTKEVHFMLNASLRELSTSPEKAILKLSEEGRSPFPNVAVPLVGVEIKNFRSSFPCSFLLSAEHLPNKEKSPVVTPSNFEGLFMLPAKSSSGGNINEPILTDEENKWASEFRSAFPTVSIDDVGKLGFGENDIQSNTKVLPNGDKEVQYLVPASNCVVSKVLQKRESLGQETQSLYQPLLGKYVISETEAQLAINEIKQELATQVRSVDLSTELKFKLSRAIISDKARRSSAMFDKSHFLDSAEIAGVIKSGNVAAELDKVHHLYVAINVKYIKPE